MLEPCRRVVLSELVHGRRDEQSRVAVHGIGHFGQREKRKIRQNRLIFMRRWVRIRSGIRTVGQKWGPVHYGNGKAACTLFTH
jgi:hypothetical protein